ncbi:hypothetical protein TNCV_3923511 [Trichonephila clavipes]|nr:hypothetical protein TNCV_3923511 [Trichonephila clavipes]
MNYASVLEEMVIGSMFEGTGAPVVELTFVLRKRATQYTRCGGYTMDTQYTMDCYLLRHQIVKDCGEEAMSRQHVAKWCRSFQSGKQDVENCNTARSGRPSSSTTEINTARVEEMIQND